MGCRRMKRFVAAAAAVVLLVAASGTFSSPPPNALDILWADYCGRTTDPACATPTPVPTPSPTLAPTATPTAAPTADPQPAFPIRATFYYPWFPEAWNQQGLNPFSHYTPTLGYYDTSAVVSQHVAAMQSAGVQAGIASWWGQGTPTDGRIPTLLANAGSFRWALYYEAEGSGNPTSATIANDLAYIDAHYAHQPGYLRVAGHPVLFVYGDATDGCSTADRWKAANTLGFYVVLKVFSGYKTCVNQPNSWHQYAPAVPEDHQAGYSFSISPGFWKANEATPRLARDTARWQTNVADMVGSKEPWQLIATFNEWGEGSGFEDTTQLGTTYRTILGGGSSPSSSPSSTPTPLPSVPSPTATPVPTVAPTPTPSPTPTPTPTSGAIRHVVVVWLENHEVSAVTSSSMPYLYGLSNTYGRADQFYAIRHPSLPNYLAFWSGSTQGVTDDGTYNLSGQSVSNQFANAGLSWRTYAQDYPATAGCHTGSTYASGTDGPGVAGTYARKHDPAMSFTFVSGTAQCANVQPLAKFDPSVAFAFVVPNLCNDAHDCSLSQADTFLKAFLPSVLNSADWAHTLLVVSFDEGSTNTNGGGHIFTMVARAGLSHFTSSTVHNHYGLLRTIENINGLPCLGASCSATPLTEFLP